MAPTPFTILEDGHAQEIAASIAGSEPDARVRVATAPLLDLLGWTQKPEGLCRGETCIPIASRPELIDADGVDLVALGELLGRPIAIDRDEAVASIAAETASHRSQLDSGIAPDFTLPDLTGKEHSLSSFKGKKVLLIAYASW